MEHLIDYFATADGMILTVVVVISVLALAARRPESVPARIVIYVVLLLVGLLVTFLGLEFILCCEVIRT